MSTHGYIEREMALVNVNASGMVRQQVLHLVEIFRARVVNVSDSILTIEVTGERSKVDAIISLLSVFGIQEMVRTGTVAISPSTKNQQASSLTE